MPTPFPGMDPYLERPGLWHEVHTGLVIDIQKFLTPLVRPQYRVAVEQRIYLSLLEPRELIGEPDVLAVSAAASEPDVTAHAWTATVGTGAYVVDLPMPAEVVERYLEVRDVITGEVITVIEILSPSNKLGDRQRYERKRLRILSSITNLVEIDLLRAGEPMPMQGDIPKSHYRILVSRSENRPKAVVYPFSVRDPIPDVPVPLRPGETEPALVLNKILHDLYDQAGYDLFIDYQQPPIPPLQDEDAVWARHVIAQAQP